MHVVWVLFIAMSGHDVRINDVDGDISVFTSNKDCYKELIKQKAEFKKKWKKVDGSCYKLEMK